MSSSPSLPGQMSSSQAGAPLASRGSTPARWAWAVWNLLQLVFTLAWTGGLIPVALLVGLFSGGAQRPLRMAAWLWAPGLLGGAGARLKVEGAEGVDWSRPVMLVANHASMIDICAMFRAVPVPLRFLLKKEMTRVPLVGRYARSTGMLFVDRADRRAGIRMIHDATAMLREGRTLCIFPEGTRSRDGRVAEFKGGAFQAAVAAGVPVVPVAIHGAGAVLPVAGLFRVRPGRIVVRFGAPIATAGSDRNTLAEAAHREVLRMLEEIDAAAPQARREG